MDRIKHIKASDYIGIITIIVAACFLFWRAQYGYIFNDEPFCLTIAQRFFNGDSPITQEWNGAQHIGIVLLPFYSAFKFITGSTTGILLAMRFIYCCLWLLVCTLAYICLKKYTKLAIFAFLYLILFSPLDYMTLSYTSISVMCAILLCILAENKKLYTTKLLPIIFGVVFAVLVLLSPFFVILYAISVLLFIGINIFYKIRKTSSINLKTLNRFYLWFNVGIFFLALPYCIFLFSRTSLQNLIIGFPNFLSYNYDRGVTKFFSYILIMLREISKPLIGFSLLVVITIFVFIDKNTKKRRLFYLFAFCLSFVFYNYNVFTAISTNFNYQMLCISLFGFALFFLLEKKPYKLFFTFYLGGIVFAMINSYSSDTGLISFSMGMCVSGVASIMFLSLLLKELVAQYAQMNIYKYLSIFLALFLLIGQIAFELNVRLTRQYWDEPLKKLTYKIEFGPAKGIYTSDFNYRESAEIYDDLQNLLLGEDLTNKSFLSYYPNPHVYLIADLDYATFSSWTFNRSGEYYHTLLNTYFALNPHKIPSLIFFYNGMIKAPEFDFSLVEGYYEKNYGDSVLLIKKN